MMKQVPTVHIITQKHTLLHIYWNAAMLIADRKTKRNLIFKVAHLIHVSWHVFSASNRNTMSEAADGRIFTCIYGRSTDNSYPSNYQTTWLFFLGNYMASQVEISHNSQWKIPPKFKRKSGTSQTFKPQQIETNRSLLLRNGFKHQYTTIGRRLKTS